MHNQTYDFSEQMPSVPLFDGVLALEGVRSYFEKRTWRNGISGMSAGTRSVTQSSTYKYMCSHTFFLNDTKLSLQSLGLLYIFLFDRWLSVTSYWLTALTEGAEGEQRPPPTCVSAAQFFRTLTTECMTPIENLWLLIIFIGGRMKGWTKTFDIPIEIWIVWHRQQDDVIKNQ